MTLLFFLLLSATAFSQEEVLNVYNWSNYIPDDVLAQFEKETHIHVNYTTFDENETLYTKLKADPYVAYDLVFPSSFYVHRMAKEGMLHPLDLTQVPNIKFLNPDLLNRSYDPHNQYSIPYLWGTSSIIVNQKFFNPATIKKWSDLWQPRFNNQLVMLNDMRDLFSVSFITLGYSINTQEPDKIKRAYEKLRLLLPNIKLFNNDAVIPIYTDEDAGVGMILNGDALQVIEANPNTHYIYPTDGVIAWVDCAVIPKNAPHIAHAYRFMNFVMRPDIAEKISEELGYSSPNLSAIKLLPKEMQDNPVINPPDSVLKHAQIEDYVDDKTMALYSYYWNLLKLSA